MFVKSDKEKLIVNGLRLKAIYLNVLWNCLKFKKIETDNYRSLIVSYLVVK